MTAGGKGNNMNQNIINIEDDKTDVEELGADIAKQFIDASLNKSSDGLWSKYLN